jgi:predicted kinase
LSLTDGSEANVMDDAAFVLLLSGPAGAGKSAAAREWARRQPGQVAHISLDDIRELLVNGFADPRDGWNAETDRQFVLARQNCADMARRFVHEGAICVIDDAIFPDWQYANHAGWLTALGDLPSHLIVLMPSYDTLVERNAQRSGSRLLGGQMLRDIYQMMLPWREQTSVPVLDTTTLTIAETAEAIQRELDRLRHQPAS